MNAAVDWQTEIAACADRLKLEPADKTDTDRVKQKVLAFEDYLRTQSGDALIVMDNVENPDQVAKREIAPKLTMTELCRQTRTRLLITTRVQALPDGFQPVEVSKLNPEDALAVLLDAWQAEGSTQPRNDPPDTVSLSEIARLFDYLPLPLGWMAATLRQKAAFVPRSSWVS